MVPRSSLAVAVASDGNKNFFTAAVSAEDLFAVVVKRGTAGRPGEGEREGAGMGSGRLMHHFAELDGRRRRKTTEGPYIKDIRTGRGVLQKQTWYLRSAREIQ